MSIGSDLLEKESNDENKSVVTKYYLTSTECSKLKIWEGDF